MGVFQDMIEAVNRAPEPITITFDGQQMTMQPGKQMIPKVVVSYAKNQNPLRGSADIDNPAASGARYLIGIVGTKDNITPLTKEEWDEHCSNPSRFNTEDIMELAASRLKPGEHMVVKGRKKQSSRFSVAINPQTEFGGDHVN